MVERIIYIYQMGKVGSSSIANSISNFFKVIHVHHLSEEMAIYSKAQFKMLNIPLNGIEMRQKLLTDILNSMKNKSEIFIITLVRDILSQNVSYFFQKHSKFLNDLSGKNNLSIEELQSVYLNKDLIYTLPRFINWFDSELKVVTGIDVFSYDFDISKGYSIIKKDNVNLLIIRMEDLNCVFSEAINQFLGVHLELKNSNQSENKKYSELYSEFKNTLNFNQELISQAYNSKLMKHFYSQEEIDSFMIKWNKNNI